MAEPESRDSATPAKVRKLSTSVLEISSEADSSVDIETQKALEDIDSCQNEIDTLNEKASEEILQVEMKYNKLRRPHYEKRNELIQQIPNFWVTVLVNHPLVSHIISEEEEECLHYLKQLSVEEFEDIKSGYALTLNFAPNPYFTNDVLKKEFHLATAGGRPMSRSTKINWKPAMDLSKRSTVVVKKRKSRREDKGLLFFDWFSGNINPTADKIAEVVKDDVWPNPLQYYLTNQIEVEENGITDDEDSDDDDLEDDSVVVVGDDDDDDEDDDDDGDDDDVYEVEGEDDSDEDLLEETVDSIEVEDDDDEDAIEVLGSDEEAAQETADSSADRTDLTADTTQESEGDALDKALQAARDAVAESEAATKALEASDPSAEGTASKDATESELLTSGADTTQSTEAEMDMSVDKTTEDEDKDAEDKLLDDAENELLKDDEEDEKSGSKDIENGNG